MKQIRVWVQMNNKFNCPLSRPVNTFHLHFSCPDVTKLALKLQQQYDLNVSKKLLKISWLYFVTKLDTEWSWTRCTTCHVSYTEMLRARFPTKLRGSNSDTTQPNIMTIKVSELRGPHFFGSRQITTLNWTIFTTTITCTTLHWSTWPPVFDSSHNFLQQSKLIQTGHHARLMQT